MGPKYVSDVGRLLLVCRCGSDSLEKMSILKNRLKALPEVEEATYGNAIIAGGDGDRCIGARGGTRCGAEGTGVKA